MNPITKFFALFRPKTVRIVRNTRFSKLVELGAAKGLDLTRSGRGYHISGRGGAVNFDNLAQVRDFIDNTPSLFIPVLISPLPVTNDIVRE